MDKKQANSLLTKITFITSLGDFLSSFAILSIFFSKTNSALKAADISRLETLAIIISGLVIAKLTFKHGAKSLIFKSQLFSFFLSLLIIIFFKSNLGVWLFSISYFLLKISEEIFKASREIESKSLGCSIEQRSLQAEIMLGFFGAQFLGPLLSVYLLKNFTIEVSLILDSLSFIICAILALQLPNEFKNKQLIEPSKVSSYLKSLFKPFSYLNKFPNLKKIFLLRTFGHSIPIGLFNFTVFIVVSAKFQRNIIDTAYIYSITGAGGLISGTIFRRKNIFKILKVEDHIISFIALFLMGLIQYAFIKVDSFYSAGILTFFSGICMSANGITSQGLRRKFSTDSQFPEIIGLEIFLSKIVELLSATVIAFLIYNGFVTSTDGILLASIILIITAFFYLFGNFKYDEK